MKPILLAGFILLLYSKEAKAQEIFITRGKIVFEKKTNLSKYAYSIFGENPGFLDQLIKDLPKYNTAKFELYFDDSTAWYLNSKPDNLTDKIPDFISTPVTLKNEYFNLNTSMVVSRKEIYDKKYLIKDHSLKINWHLTNETRDIIGFKCRKAFAIIYDSLFLVAFYSEQIVCSSGPESMSGLPGMILGLAIPRFNTTWFATSVDPLGFKKNPDSSLQKFLTEQEFETELTSNLSSYQKEKKIIWWQCVL